MSFRYDKVCYVNQQKTQGQPPAKGPMHGIRSHLELLRRIGR